jgi:hypothetical protein
MKCPKCGADNPEGAPYCSLCLQQLAPSSPGPGGPTQPAQPAQREPYVAPGEWRGEAGLAKPHTSEVIESRARRFRWKTALIAGLLVIVVVWIVLSFTVLGNPTPGDRSMQLIEALNNRDFESFNEIIIPDRRADSEKLYDDFIYFLGTDGTFTDIKLDVVQDNQYDARSHVVGGKVLMRGSSEPVDITEADNLIIILENHKGTWYVIPRGTILIP